MKRLFSVVMFLCALAGFSASATFGAVPSNGAPQEASKLALKERWMRVPAELRLTPAQTTQFHKYASELHQAIRAEHQAVIAKLKTILTTGQFENLRKWGEAYRKNREERTRLTDAEMNQSLDATSKQLGLTANQEKRFKDVSFDYHSKKSQLFDQFCANVNKILTDSQRLKFAEMKEDL